jgi:hypothetical protein
MPRKKELPAPDSGEQDDLLSAETQEFPDAPLTEPVVEPMKAHRRMIRRRRNTRNFFRH